MVTALTFPRMVTPNNNMKSITIDGNAFLADLPSITKDGNTLKTKALKDIIIINNLFPLSIPNVEKLCVEGPIPFY